ncbi:cysteine--tRNA ligase [Methanobrevibacter curvatus]|uniref:Cysteine--tRNA ligase n=1 Tax=Methanobrevibacter curvatus TaxID=49547 RepID=A0A166AGF3_9EURY|nr:cysteine--tRNA ligase [Methanobrevibacter curvatus]KZX12001.1 cysteine--tRNA ligase [Methanobrevibacter curvatus]
MLEIYNTMKRDKVPFKPINDKRINLFVCGPTVYDDAHIGHGRTYVSFDLIKSYLEFKGYFVYYIENITDIDDKIIKRSKEKNIDSEILAKFYEKRFKEDMEKLNIKGVNLFPRATEHLKEISSQIERLLSKGIAYESDDGVYFEVAKFPDYGKLSNQDLKKLDGHRLETNENKKDAKDFALWKKTEETPNYPSKWGNGRPGWHIEDTAITETYFGPQYDIHGGGLDLIFPHHEAEIAQMEAVSGLKPLVKYWMHTGFLNVDGVKMSKSLGNFITIRELLEDWEAMAFRLFVLSTHYRSPIDFSEKSLNQASKNLKRIKFTTQNLIESKEEIENIIKTHFNGKIDLLDEIMLENKNIIKNKNIEENKNAVENEENQKSLSQLNEFKNNFFKSLDDDFNTPKALANILNFTKTINTFITTTKSEFVKIENINLNKLKFNYKYILSTLKLFKDFENIFKLGIFEKEEQNQDNISNDSLNLLCEVREKLREEKKYELSDYIRDKINELGIDVEDK